ncbi:hypothetical protein ACS0TY_029108 [Phlomoides rotata]
MALEDQVGNADFQYSLLWDYTKEIRRTNPGFCLGCRPLIDVDDTLLKGPHGGVLLSAVGVDPCYTPNRRRPLHHHGQPHGEQVVNKDWTNNFGGELADQLTTDQLRMRPKLQRPSRGKPHESPKDADQVPTDQVHTNANRPEDEAIQD